MNSDDSITRLKGTDRPINRLEDRLDVLSALECIDYLIPFSEDTPLELIQEIVPDVLVKGADYKPEEVVGGDFVIAHGGTLELIQYIDGKSTTNLITKIRN